MRSQLQHRRSVASAAWIAAATLALTACSGGGGGGGGGGEPAPARVAALAAPSTIQGDVALEFQLTSDQPSTADVEILVSRDGGATYRDVTLREGSLLGLASSPTGVAHRVVWDSLADLGFRVEDDIELAVQTRDAVAAGGAAAAKASAPGQKKKQPEAVTATAGVDNAPAAANRLESHLYYLGPMDAAKVAVAEVHDLVVLNPCDATVTAALVAEIQDGVDAGDPTDDVLVLGYLNAGQDPRTVGLSDAQLLASPAFVGSGTGPRVDPRGPNASGQALTGLPLIGSASVSGGYASWYLDDNSVEQNGVGDGLPDRSGYTGACYVNAGDPAWYDALADMTCVIDGVAGMREQLTTSYGASLGLDGLFVDRIDTCSPNAWTSSGDPGQVEFEWTAAGFAAFLRRLRADYPSAVLMQNRGLFFYDSARPHYMVHAGDAIDLVGFSSYRLDAATWREFDPYFFADNKHNVIPRLQVEAYRPEGFQLLSIGHAAGPGIDPRALVGGSVSGIATLLTDIVEAQRLAGMRHYLTDQGAQLVNSFVLDNADFSDTEPPVWTSTYNDNQPGFPTPPNAATPRVGVQEAIPGNQSVTVRWDVALDLNPVSYVLYYGERRMRIDPRSGQPDGKRVVVLPEVGDGYSGGPGQQTFPYQVTVSGLKSKTRYYFILRAIDSLGNEDQNQVQIDARTLANNVSVQIDGDFRDWKDVGLALRDPDDVPPSGGPNWREIKLHNDAQNLYVFFRSENEFNLDGSPGANYSRTLICIDVDGNPFTGWPIQTIGGELKVAGDGLYTQSNTVFSEQFLQRIAVNPTTKVNKCELAIPLSQLDAVYGGTATKVRLIFANDDAWDLAPDRGHLEFNLVR